MKTSDRMRLMRLTNQLEASLSRREQLDTTDNTSQSLIDQLTEGKGLMKLRLNKEVDTDDDMGDDASSIRYDDSDGDSDYSVESTTGDYLDEQELLRFLNETARDLIHAKYNPDLRRVQAGIPGFRPDKSLKPHQFSATAFAYGSMDTVLKGALLGDLGGLGKTLPALCAIAIARQDRRNEAYGPCVIVAPPSLTDQWANEISRFFEPNSIKVLKLRGEPVVSSQLCQFDVVITSYSQVLSEFTRRLKFERLMAEYQSGQQDVPRRPRVSLLSDMFLDNPSKMGQILVLDEEQVIKNTRSRTYAAVRLLRQMFTACIMLTATPLDNTWQDAFSVFSLLKAVPIYSPKQMKAGFCAMDKSNPSHNYAVRFKRCLDAVILRRPKTGGQLVIQNEPDMVKLPEEDLDESNTHFAAYRKSQGMNGDKKKAGKSVRQSTAVGTATGGEGDQKEDAAGVAWGSLIKAQQVAYHPKLAEIMHLENRALEAVLSDNVADEQLYDEDNEKVEAWKRDLRNEMNYRSPRVDRIVDIIHKHLDQHGTDVFVVMEESVYFLEILKMALDEDYAQLPTFSYDGRSHPSSREQVLEAFRSQEGPRVLLASRGTGGVGLNLQCANVLIICGPWWKVAWEEQAIWRIDRQDQEKTVYVYRVRAKDCDVEEYKAQIRDGKHVVVSRFMDDITHVDGYDPGILSKCY